VLSSESTIAKKAIVIGINKYESDSEIPTLAGAENDAQEICERLKNNGNFEISQNHLLLGSRATRKNISKAISELFRKENKTNLITFFFAGHGVLDNNRALNTNDGYIAPYDMDPEDPYVSGIRMGDLRNVISASKNDASVIMFLDCCFAGIAAKDTTRGNQRTVMVNPETRNMFASEVKNMIEPTNQSSNLQGGRGKIILASSEADEAAREIGNCRHLDRDDPHPHGAFSFYLIEGLDGKAADPDTGVITIGSIRNYIEEQMRDEGKQTPVYHIADASRIDNIKLAISQERYNAKIKQIVDSAEACAAARYGILNLADMQSLAEAAKKVGDLASLDPNNKKIPILRKSVEAEITSYFEPTTNWFITNMEPARLMINKIEPALFDQGLQELILGLNFDELQKMDQNKLDSLIVLSIEVANNTKFRSPDDPKLRIFHGKLSASFRRGSRV
jgi:uncharacterized caspase-like protein